MVEKEKKKTEMNKKKEPETPQRSEFQWLIWTVFALENWILDFGRPIAMLIFPMDWFPLNRPSVGDYFHMAYNVITPFCIYNLMSKVSKRSKNELLVNLCVIFFIMGASIHLVGDSINHRLSLIGYQFHLSLEDNPIMKQLQPKDLVKSFELLYYYDEVLGHYMWYIPFFICLCVYFLSCFETVDPKAKKAPFSVLRTQLKSLLLIFNASYYWYLVTEGQITPLFLLVLAFMHLAIFYHKLTGLKKLDENGQFLINTFQITLLLVAGWCWYFWDDPELRAKYPGLIYVPEPWSVYSLHYRQYYDIFAH